MFGIEDPGIRMAYLLAVACLIFAVWYGLSHWNSEEDTDGE
jgi:hypothetical protein